MSKEKREAVKKKCEEFANILAEMNDFFGDTYGSEQMFCSVSSMDALWIRLGECVERLQRLRKNGSNPMGSEELEAVTDIALFCILLLCENDSISDSDEEEQDDGDDFDDADDDDDDGDDDDYDDADDADDDDTDADDEIAADVRKPKKTSRKKKNR